MRKTIAAAGLLALSALPASAAFNYPFGNDAPTPLEMFGPQSTYGNNSFDMGDLKPLISMGLKIGMNFCPGGIGGILCSTIGGMVLDELDKEPRRERRLASNPRTGTQYAAASEKSITAIRKREYERGREAGREEEARKRVTIRRLPETTPVAPRPPMTQQSPPPAPVPNKQFAPSFNKDPALMDALWRSVEHSMQPILAFEPETVIPPRLRGFSDSAKAIRPIIGLPIESPDTGTVVKRYLMSL